MERADGTLAAGTALGGCGAASALGAGVRRVPCGRAPTTPLVRPAADAAALGAGMRATSARALGRAEVSCEAIAMAGKSMLLGCCGAEGLTAIRCGPSEGAGAAATRLDPPDGGEAAEWGE